MYDPHQAVRHSRLVRGVAVALAVGLLAFLPAAVGARSAEEGAAASPKWVQTATQRLAKLEEKPASPTGYARSKFGPEWDDVDLNGCKTRDDILARDLKQVTFKAGSQCVVSKGTLNDPYTGTTTNFVRGPGTSLKVQIDHVVALSAAWRTGAKEWSAERRLFYANDPLVLLAVDGPTNGSKGDRDASAWLPPRVAYHCRYVAKQIAIKTKWELWVTAAEAEKMTHVLSDC